MPEPSTRRSAPDAGAAAMYAVMVEKVRDYAIFLLDPNGIVSSWNPAAQAMKGYAPAEIIGEHLRLLYREEDRRAGAPEHTIAMAMRHGVHQEEGFRRRKDGSLFWAQVELIAITDSTGKLTGFCKITKDLTARRNLETALQREKDRAEVTLRAIGDGVVAVDTEGLVELINPEAQALTGWTEESARGRRLGEVMRVEDTGLGQGSHPLLSTSAADELEPLTAGDVMLRSRDGTQYVIEATRSPIVSANGELEGGVVVFRDVTESRKKLGSFADRASRDPLTGLVNRAEFDKRLARAQAHASGGAFTSALIYLDLDRFKTVNDTCGHHAGDALLRLLAATYARHIRDRDTLARLGGDEFALIIEQCSLENAEAVADKILRATRELDFEHDGRKFDVGVSIGIHMFGDTSEEPVEILQMADQACYLAKAYGRNQVQPSPRCS